MSRGHQQNRRRSYGRRQHELHERRDRHDVVLVEDGDLRPVVDLDSAVERLGRLAFAPRAVTWAEGAA